MASHLIACNRLYLGFLVFLFQQQVIRGNICAPGARTKGYTTPTGDIYRKTGSDLIINCTLNSDVDGGNSSDIRWELDTTINSVSSVTVVDDYTAQLRIHNAKKDRFNAYCKWKNDINICQNVVYILDPPPQNVAINCTSYDFNRITCEWPEPYKNDPKQPDVTFKQDINESFRNCSNHISPPNGYSINDDSCAYRVLCFRVDIQNKIGRSTSWIAFDQYRNVLLSAPTNLKLKEITETSANISWEDDEKHADCVDTLMESNPQSSIMEYKLFIKKKTEFENGSYEINKTKELLLRELIPHTEYVIEIQCRFVYEGFHNPWSSKSRKEFKTIATVPATSPSNVIADISLDSSEMNVTLFWTGMPKQQQLGDDFRYSINMTWNETESVVVTTKNTYILFSNISTLLHYTFKVQAENEVGAAKDVSFYNITQDIESEPVRLKLNDVIVHDDPGEWKYYLSWKTYDTKEYNVTVYWCRGNKSADGLIPCDDSGIHLQETVSSKDSRYNFSLPNPSQQTYFLGVTTEDLDKNRRILWSSCVIPKSRKPLSPELTYKKVEPTLIKLAWKHLECEQRSAYLTGYRIYVYLGEKEITSYNVTADVTDYSVKDLLPQTQYKFLITTITSHPESISKPIFLSTSAHSTTKMNVLPIVIPIALVFLLVSSLGIYHLWKRIKKKINNLIVVLPNGFTSQDPSEDFNQNKTGDPEKLGNTSSKSAVDYELPFYGIDDLSSPKGSSLGSSPDSGYAPETPTSDTDGVFDYDNFLDKEKSLVDSNKGYTKASILDEISLTQLEDHSCVASDPFDYSTIGMYKSSGCTDFPLTEDTSLTASDCVVVDTYHLTATPADTILAKKLPAVTLLNRLQTELGNAEDKTNVADRVVQIPTLGKEESTVHTEPQNETLNSVGGVGYAQLSFAMDQNRYDEDLNKDGYTVVAVAEDAPLTSQSPHHQPCIKSTSCADSAKAPYIFMKSLATSIPVPDSHDIISANGYTCLAESHLESSRSINDDSLTCNQPASAITCNEVDDLQKTANVKTEASDGVSRQVNSGPFTAGYVPATNLSALKNDEAQECPTNQSCHSPPSTSYKKLYEPVQL